MEKSKDRRTTAPAPGGSSDDGHLKPRALTEEELAKKKEREGNIAADLDRKRSLFAGASTSAKKPNPTETEKTHDTFTRMIPLRPLPLSASQKKAKPSDKQFQRFNDLAQDRDAAAKFDLPSLDEMHELDRWRLDLQNLQNMTPEPDNYCDRAEALVNKIKETVPRFKMQFELISPL